MKTSDEQVPSSRGATPKEANLPSGWAEVTVEILAANEPAAITDGPFGSNLKSDHYTETGPRVIRLQNIGDGVFLDEEAHISETHFKSLRKHEACADDVVVAMLGEELPRACLVPAALGPAIVKADCVRLRVHPEVAIPAYVMAGLNSQALRRQAAALMHGVGRPRLGLQWFRGLRFPVAPLREQRLIVEAIESYFSRLDDAVATLKRVERNLKRYRASVLKAAVEGRLVSTEAALAKQEDRDYEPATVLLERILSERRQRWSESGKKGKYQEPTPPDTSNLPDLPEGWCWATVDSLIWDAGYGTSQKCSYEANGPAVLRIPNIQEQSLRLDDLKFATDPEHLDADGAVTVGDLLFIRTNGSRNLIGRGAVVLDELPSPHHFASYLIRLRVLQEACLPRWVGFVWHTSVLREQVLADAASSAGQYNVSMKAATHFVVPLAPVAEQIRILNEIERIDSLAEATIASTSEATERSGRLRQSILKWAFEGELADQDPDDEPASILLERIRAEREPNDLKMSTRSHRGVGKKQGRA